MKIQLKDINHYFLTVDTNGVRKHHMMDIFSSYKVTEINPILGIEKNKSGIIGVSRMIDAGLRSQDRTKPFQPFVVYEDDCSFYRPLPESIEVPDDADVVYVGISKCSMSDNSWHHMNYFTHVSDTVVRINNMLSTHGYMFCSAAGAVAIQRAIMEGYYTGAPWDIPMAYIQPYYNIYALKEPLVYQDKQYGGMEEDTRFSFTNMPDNPLPPAYLNRTNDSILMASRY